MKNFQKPLNFNHIIDNIPSGYIKESNIHGYGLFSKYDLFKGVGLGDLDGQLINWDKYYELQSMLNVKDEERYTNPMFLEWNCLGNIGGEKDLPENTRLLVRPLRTKYSFINHSRDPNCELRHHPLRVVTIKDIKKDEELTLDYRREPLPDIYYEEHGNSYL